MGVEFKFMPTPKFVVPSFFHFSFPNDGDDDFAVELRSLFSISSRTGFMSIRLSVLSP